MKRAIQALAFVAVLAASTFTSKAAHADFLFVGIKRINIAPGSPNDCLTIALATMRNLGFANLKRANDVSGTRAGVFLSACAPAPGDNSFWVFIAGIGGNANTTRATVELVRSNV